MISSVPSEDQKRILEHDCSKKYEFEEKSLDLILSTKVSSLKKINEDYVDFEKKYFQGVACTVCNAQRNKFFSSVFDDQN